MKYSVALILLFQTYLLSGQNNFPPPDTLQQIKATRIHCSLVIDGRLDEAEWLRAQPVQLFKQVDPQQGSIPAQPTTVRILFNEEYLYVGAFCADSMGMKGLRVQNVARDFDASENDMFGIQIDPFNTKRNAFVFQTTAYGAQRDLQTFDDIIRDEDWDALWKVRTHRTDSGWYGEFAIPFKTIRYPNVQSDSVTWNFNYIRTIRRLYEVDAFPGYPRSLSPYRMGYSAALTGLTLPKKGNNLRFIPYVNYQANRFSSADSSYIDSKPKFGGEIKWSPNPNTTLDLTVNTDFAQADADRQVINLKRFSVFFPERRQFFLENAGIYSPGFDGILKPFYSRSIGIDASGMPIPIDVGARYTVRNITYNTGFMMIKQRGDAINPDAYIGVGRLMKNYGRQNNIGVLLTNKYDVYRNGLPSNNNLTVGLDGVHRFSQKTTLEYIYSHSVNNDSLALHGNAGGVSLDYNSNKAYLFTSHQLISEAYNPALGFVSRNDLLANNFGGFAILRPKWKPKFIRSFEPGAIAFVYQSQKTLTFQEGFINIFLLYFLFNDGSSFEAFYQPNWQHLPVDFYPVRIQIEKGNYQYNRYLFSYRTDQSKKWSVEIAGSTGGYFNGTLNEASGSIRIVPIPLIAFKIDYEFNSFKGVGINQENLNTQLITFNTRLALNPRVQLIGFYQYNSAADNTRWNIRLSWEYKPLSYLYVVFNQLDYVDEYASKITEQQGIFKVTYLKQF